MPHTPSRRDFLRTTTAAAAGLALAAPTRASAAPLRGFGAAKSCIFINMVGGPAHLDTFDPKPDAPSDVRGPFAPIQTNVPGVRVSELFPKLAAHADKFALVRSMHHDAPPVHECGFQLLNTGRLFRDGPEWPSAGAVDYLVGRKASDISSWHVWPNADISTGIAVGHGQSAGWLRFDIPTPATLHPVCANTPFNDCCLIATAISKLDCRFITINQFSTVFDAPSWDCHADGGSLRTTLNDVRDTVAPSFDTAVSALLAQLEESGLLESTLVVATGEFGRTPKLNSNGGRDHWAGCWTALVAGGGTKGGQIVGASDRTGSEPAERPVSPQELVASIFHALGIARDATIPGPDGAPVSVYPANPVSELF
jgi:Protein of unknown function (DUF1501)/TAT (twin-arginine translocation) pathway signal sequence